MMILNVHTSLTELKNNVKQKLTELEEETKQNECWGLQNSFLVTDGTNG
jgi:hypothetical protein